LPFAAGITAFPGLSVFDDGLLIDLGPMKGIRVDPKGERRAPKPVCCWASSIAVLEDDQRGTPRLGGVPAAGVVTEPANRTDAKRCWSRARPAQRPAALLRRALPRGPCSCQRVARRVERTSTTHVPMRKTTANAIRIAQ
jgi:hypothetical protein